jgi:undecaprenyl-diphosphatase
MSILQAILLGALQGVTEFLPVSSSGHLAVLKHSMGVGEVGLLFDVLLHVASLLAVILVFRMRIARMVMGLIHWIQGKADDEDRGQVRSAGVLIVATIITGTIGILVKDFAEGLSVKVVSALFLVTAVILLVSQRFGGTKGYQGLTIKDGLICGVAQGMGVFPGISRAGITISAGLGSGMDRQTAGEFSFLLSIPAILGALVLTLKDFSELSGQVSLGPLVAGAVASFLVGLVSLVLLMRIVRAGKLGWFALYLIPLGLLGILFL